MRMFSAGFLQPAPFTPAPEPGCAVPARAGSPRHMPGGRARYAAATAAPPARTPTATANARTHPQVPLHAVRALHQEAQKSPFAHTPWRTGALHLRFLPVRPPGGRVDVVPIRSVAWSLRGHLVNWVPGHPGAGPWVPATCSEGPHLHRHPCIPHPATPQDDDARRRTRVADLHAQRSVLAVVGVVHCPLVEDMAAAHAEFGRVARWAAVAVVLIGEMATPGWCAVGAPPIGSCSGRIVRQRSFPPLMPSSRPPSTHTCATACDRLQPPPNARNRPQAVSRGPRGALLRVRPLGAPPGGGGRRHAGPHDVPGGWVHVFSTE